MVRVCKLKMEKLVAGLVAKLRKGHRGTNLTD